MEYDVALSFAGEDREYVEAVALELKSLGVRVFYDKFETANLWGKDLYTHLQNVYQKQAKYTVIFISEHYAKKLWTNHERKMAQARAFTESREYILPAKFDDTEIEGIVSTTGYIDLRQYIPQEFSNLIYQKLKIESSEQKAEKLAEGQLQRVEAERKRPDQKEAKRQEDERKRLEVEAKKKKRNATKKTAIGISIGVLAVLILSGLIWTFSSSSHSDMATNTASTNSSDPNTFKNSIGMEFVKIPSGSFMMGSDKDDDEKPIHKVIISQDFWLQKTEVTQGQWKSVMGNNPSFFKECGDNCPVENVSWDDAQEYIKNLNVKGEGAYRLPTEAEWEYAARAGTACTSITYLQQQIAILENKPPEDRYPGDFAQYTKLKKELADCITGDYAGNLDSIVWYKENSDKKTHAVATKQANTLGLYDMYGNVWEWTSDWAGSYPSGTVTDPTGTATGLRRIKRGGGWYDDSGILRSAYRRANTPSDHYYNLGFRLVRQ
jgi:formylglycine-generating enzyme required for sulfatase activity